MNQIRKLSPGFILGSILFALIYRWGQPIEEAHAMAKKPDSKKSVSVSGAQCALPVNDAELRKKLSPEQYRIVRQKGTEAPFKNAYWDNKKPGIYVDIVTGEPLFSSTDKFDSGTGWPSFTIPIQKDSVVEKSDIDHGMIRQEIRSAKGDSHLGHVFPDGPQSAGGMRYCINSASLRFIPVEEMEKESYGKYLYLFKKEEKK